MNHPRPHRGGAEINHLALLFTIALGVTIGNLASNWITARVVALEVEMALRDAGRRTQDATRRMQQQADAAQEQSRAAIAAQQAQTRERRRLDANGMRLTQTCDEWRRAHAQLSSYTTLTEMTRHCDRLDRYLETGGLGAP